MIYLKQTDLMGIQDRKCKRMEEGIRRVTLKNKQEENVFRAMRLLKQQNENTVKCEEIINFIQ